MSLPEEIFRVLGEKLGASATVRTVYGEPVTVGDRTIIPVAKVGYGMGGGGGGVNSERSGGGGGGGMGALPVGVVEVTAEGARFIRFSGTTRLAGAIGIGFLFGFLVARLTKG